MRSHSGTASAGSKQAAAASISPTSSACDSCARAYGKAEVTPYADITVCRVPASIPLAAPAICPICSSLPRAMRCAPWRISAWAISWPITTAIPSWLRATGTRPV